jgi:hypothetical protein
MSELFARPMLVRLDRQTDRDKPCCENIASVGPGKGPHAAELRCANCGSSRGWLRREALDFLTETTRRFGAPVEPLTLRDNQIGDYAMTEKPKYDNSGILFRNDNKANDRPPITRDRSPSAASSTGSARGSSKARSRNSCRSR